MASSIQRKCLNCNMAITVRLADVKRGWGNFCSKRCKAISQKRRNHIFDSGLGDDPRDSKWGDHD